MKMRYPIRLLLRLGLFLLCALILSAAAGARTYTDVAGHWAEDVIVRWSDQGILNGYADGTFRPNAPVTRAQLAEILYRLLGYPASEGYAFEDLPKDSWCYESLTTMNLYRVAVNTGDRIYPNEAVTRAEAAHMIAEAFGISSHEWAFEREKAFEEQMNSLKRLKYLQGDASGNLNPTQQITRAEVLTILDRIAQHVIREPGVYDIPFGESVVVTCRGVTLNFVRTSPSQKRSSNGFFLFDGAAGDVTLDGGEIGPDRWSYTLNTYCIYENEKPNFVDGRNCKAHAYERQATPGDPKEIRTDLFQAGCGSALFPYVIKTPEQFMNLLKFTDSHYAGRHFLLCSDMVLPDIREPLGYDGGRTIYAELDGGGHTVTYHMQDASYDLPAAGLFHSWSGSCTDLTLNGTVDLTLSSKALKDDLFVFGGFSGNTGRFTGCTTKLDVAIRCQAGPDTRLMIGGFSGFGLELSACLDDCVSDGTILVDLGTGSGDAFVGGLVGSCGTEQGAGCRMVGSRAAGSITVRNGSHTMIGGLAGLATLSATESVRPVQGREWMQPMMYCASTATLSASGAALESDVGGLVGQLYQGNLAYCWAKPVITVEDTVYPNIGAIAGKAETGAAISNCWVNASGLDTGGQRHTGGLVGRLLGRVSECYVVGGGAFAEKNVFAYEDWNEGAVEGCLNLTAADARQRAALLDGSGWDFNEIWDRSGAYPILRQCGAAAQRAAQS